MARRDGSVRLARRRHRLSATHQGVRHPGRGSAGDAFLWVLRRSSAVVGTTRRLARRMPREGLYRAPYRRDPAATTAQPESSRQRQRRGRAASAWRHNSLPPARQHGTQSALRRQAANSRIPRQRTPQCLRHLRPLHCDGSRQHLAKGPVRSHEDGAVT